MWRPWGVDVGGGVIKMRREVAMGENEIHGATRVVGFDSNLPVEVNIIGATLVPFVTLMDSNERSSTTRGCRVRVIQVGRDGKDLHVMAELLVLLSILLVP